MGSLRRRLAAVARTSEAAVGAFAIAAGFGALGFLDADVLALLFWLGSAVTLLGLRELAIGIAASARRKAIRLLHVAAGVVAANLGFVVAGFPGFGVATLIGFLFIGLFAFGGAHVGVGVSSSLMPSWSRGYYVAVGMLNVLLGPLVLLMPGQPRLTLVLLASAALVVDGVAIVVSWTVNRRILPANSPAAKEGHP